MTSITKLQQHAGVRQLPREVVQYIFSVKDALYFDGHEEFVLSLDDRVG